MSTLIYTENHDEKYKLVVEQLEVCAQLIGARTPSKSRMAIILLDNLVDVLMLRYCKYNFSEDEFLSSYLTPKYTDEQKSSAERSIQGKIDLLKNSVLTKKQVTIISICHAYRNSAQHNDIHNPKTTIAISQLFFCEVSNLFYKLKKGGHIAYYADGLPEWASKYPYTERGLDYKKFAGIVAKELQKGIKISLPQLKEALILDIKSRLESIAEISDEIPPSNDKELDVMMKMYQYEASEDFKNLNKSLYEARYLIHDGSINYHDYGDVVTEVKKQDIKMRTAFKPQYRIATLRKIESAYKSLNTKKDVHLTLSAYRRFDEPLEAIERIFSQAEEEWCKWLDLMSDIARGK